MLLNYNLPPTGLHSITMKPPNLSNYPGRLQTTLVVGSNSNWANAA